MQADLANFIWELCILPHKVDSEHKDKFQACLLGLEDMNPNQFFYIFKLREGLKSYNCATCKWFLSGACHHPFMPMKLLDGIFSTAGSEICRQLPRKIDSDKCMHQQVSVSEVCNEWTPQDILDSGYHGFDNFIDDLLERNLDSIPYGEERFWNSIKPYIDKGFGDCSKECIEFFKNWMLEIRNEFIDIRDAKYDFKDRDSHDKKIIDYKNKLKFELYTFWMRRPKFADPLERYND